MRPEAWSHEKTKQKEKQRENVGDDEWGNKLSTMTKFICASNGKERLFCIFAISFHPCLRFSTKTVALRNTTIIISR